MAYRNMTEGKGSKYFQGKIVNVSMDSVKIFEGSVVFLSNGKALYTASNGLPYMGVAVETVDNSGNVGNRIDVHISGVFEFTSSSLTDSSLGKTVYLDTSANPNTVTVTKPTTQGALVVPVGKIAKVLSATECMVRIDGFAMVEDVAIVA